MPYTTEPPDRDPTLNEMDSFILAGDYARTLRNLRIQTGINLYKLCALIRDTKMSLRELARHFANAGYNEGKALAQAARIRSFANNEEAYQKLKLAVTCGDDSFDFQPPATAKRTKKK